MICRPFSTLRGTLHLCAGEDALLRLTFPGEQLPDGAEEGESTLLEEGAAWLEGFLDQWCAFPAGAHDDMVDSSTQALAWLLHKSGEPVEPARVDPAEPADGTEAPAFDTGALYDVYGQGGWPV